jgi:O-antigen ligase
MEYFKKNILLIDDSTKFKNIIIVSSAICVLSLVCILTIGFLKALIVLAGLSVIILALIKIDYLLYFLLIIMPLVTQVIKDVPTVAFWGVALLIFLFWFIKKMLTSEVIDLPPRWLIIFIALFVFWVFVSNIHAGVNSDNMLAAIRILLFFLFFFIAYDIIKLENFKKYFWAMVMPILFSSLVLIILALQARSIIDILFLVTARKAGYFMNANVFAGLIILYLPVTLSIYLFAKNIKHRSIYLYLSIILIISLIITNSRAAYLAFFISVMFIILLLKKRHLYIAVILALCLVLYLSPISSIVFDLLLRRGDILSGRDIIWRGSYDIFIHSPIFGVGTGNFGLKLNEYFPLIYFKNCFGAPQHAHNYFLYKMAEMGIFGLFFMLYLFYRLIKDSIICTKITNNPGLRTISIGVAAMVIGFTSRSIFEAMGVISIGGLFPDLYFWVLVIFVLKISKKM